MVAGHIRRFAGTTLVALALVASCSGSAAPGTSGALPTARSKDSPVLPPVATRRPGAAPAPTLAAGRTLAPTPAPARTLAPGANPTPIAQVPTLGSVPGSADFGAPGWAQAGTRLSFYGAAASVAQSYYTYVEDPEGDWEDPRTGKRYRRSDTGGDAQDMPTAAGQGFTQTDVVAVEGTDVVLTNTLYGLDYMSNRFGLTPLGGSRMAGAVVDGGWINPDLLRNIEAAGYQDLQILRGPYTLGSTRYQAISFINTASGAYQDSSYDTATGVLLATNTSTKGQDSPVHGPLDNPQGNTQLSLTRFVGTRQRSLPGLGAPVPDWVARTSQLVYSGTYTAFNPYDPSGVFTWPMEQTVQFGAGGRTWATFTNHTVVTFNGIPQSSDGKGVASSVGLYWYDPAALATMSPGQLLDEDPVTGARITVESVEPGGTGAVVNIQQQLNGVLLQLGYDRDRGVLLTFRMRSETAASDISVQLTQGAP